MQTRNSSPILALLLVAAFGTAAIGSEPLKELEEVQSLTLPELRAVTSVVTTRDGRFAYAAAFHAGAVTTFKRDVQTGHLSYEDAIEAPGLKAAVSVNLSPDEKYAVVSAFGANTVTLF